MRTFTRPKIPSLPNPRVLYVGVDDSNHGWFGDKSQQYHPLHDCEIWVSIFSRLQQDIIEKRILKRQARARRLPRITWKELEDPERDFRFSLVPIEVGRELGENLLVEVVTAHVTDYRLHNVLDRLECKVDGRIPREQRYRLSSQLNPSFKAGVTIRAVPKKRGREFLYPHILVLADEVAHDLYSGHYSLDQLNNHQRKVQLLI